MSRVRTSLIVGISLLVSATLFAQAKPGQPGPPSTAPQVVVDSTGKTVGEVIELVNGLSKAYVKYVLPNGESVVMTATSGGLRGGIEPQSSGNPNNATVYFKSNDCSGDAYIHSELTSSTNQLTRYQSATIFGMLASQLPPPVFDPNCPMPFPQDEWLYTAVSGACPVWYDQFHPITFSSYSGDPGSGTNAPGAGPRCFVPQGATITLPVQTNSWEAGGFIVYSPTENLSLKFKAPFYVK